MSIKAKKKQKHPRNQLGRITSQHVEGATNREEIWKGFFSKSKSSPIRMTLKIKTCGVRVEHAFM